MPINLQNVAKVKNNIIRELLNDYVELRLIGVDKTGTASTRDRAYLLTVTDNFSYKSRANLQGQNDHYVYFVAETDEQHAAANDCSAVELVDADGNFLRFDFFPSSKKQPEPPLREWEFRLKPNRSDRGTIA